ncbi:MAG: hypothetical protein LKE39_00560 [Sphaerochaeta sp.]|nr:hypothetical protein [Sphaerochaeta sp.]
MNTIEELAGLIGKRLDPDQMRAVTTLGGTWWSAPAPVRGRPPSCRSDT